MVLIPHDPGGSSGLATNCWYCGHSRPPLDFPGCLRTFLAAFGRSWPPSNVPGRLWTFLGTCSPCCPLGTLVAAGHLPGPISYSGSVLALDLSESRSCLKLGCIPVVPAPSRWSRPVRAVFPRFWLHPSGPGRIWKLPPSILRLRKSMSVLLPLFTGNYICD